MGLIVAFPILEFSIGSYQFNAFTYPAWSSLMVQIPSVISNCVFLRKVENTGKKKQEQLTKISTKKIYLSTGVFLVLSLFFFNGYFLFAILYSLPIVMLDGYGW